MKLIIALLLSISAFANYTTSLYTNFLTLEQVEFERAYLMEGKVNRGKLVKATNNEDFPVCIVSYITSSNNVKNEFFNGGKVIIQPGQTEPLGGFTQVNKTKNWNAKWTHIRRKNLRSCSL